MYILKNVNQIQLNQKNMKSYNVYFKKCKSNSTQSKEHERFNSTNPTQLSLFELNSPYCSNC